MTGRSFYFVPATEHTAIFPFFRDLDVAVAKHDVNCVGFWIGRLNMGSAEVVSVIHSGIGGFWKRGRTCLALYCTF